MNISVFVFQRNYNFDIFKVILSIKDQLIAHCIVLILINIYYFFTYGFTSLKFSSLKLLKYKERCFKIYNSLFLRKEIFKKRYYLQVDIF